MKHWNSFALGCFAVGIIFAVLLVILIYCFFGTEIGCALRATGNNPDMVRAMGTNTKTMIIIGLVIGNGLVAMSGGLIAQYQGYADIQMGVGTIVIGLAAVIIGEVLFSKRTYFHRLAGRDHRFYCVQDYYIGCFESQHEY